MYQPLLHPPSPGASPPTAWPIPPPPTPGWGPGPGPRGTSPRPVWRGLMCSLQSYGLKVNKNKNVHRKKAKKNVQKVKKFKTKCKKKVKTFRTKGKKKSQCSGKRVEKSLKVHDNR